MFQNIIKTFFFKYFHQDKQHFFQIMLPNILKNIYFNKTNCENNDIYNISILISNIMTLKYFKTTEYRKLVKLFLCDSIDFSFQKSGSDSTQSQFKNLHFLIFLPPFIFKLNQVDRTGKYGILNFFNETVKKHNYKKRNCKFLQNIRLCLNDPKQFISTCPTFPTLSFSLNVNIHLNDSISHLNFNNSSSIHDDKSISCELNEPILNSKQISNNIDFTQDLNDSKSNLDSEKSIVIDENTLVISKFVLFFHRTLKDILDSVLILVENKTSKKIVAKSFFTNFFNLFLVFLLFLTQLNTQNLLNLLNSLNFLIMKMMKIMKITQMLVF